MGYETHRKSTNTTQKDHGDYGGEINAIIIFDEDDPEPKIIEVDPDDFTRELFRFGNRCNWSRKFCKNIIEVIVADAATTTEVAEAATNTDAAVNRSDRTDHNNTAASNIEKTRVLVPVAEAKLTELVIKTTEVAINTDTTNKPAETFTEVINVADKEIVTDLTTADKAITTDMYTADKATKTDLQNKEIATNTKNKRVTIIPSGIKSFVKKTEDCEVFSTKPGKPFYNPAIKSPVTKMDDTKKVLTKASTSKVITIKSPATQAASSAYIPVPTAAAGTGTTATKTNDKALTTGPGTVEKSTDTYIIPHKVASQTKLFYPKYTDTREAAVKAVSDIAGTAELVAATKVAANDAPTKEIGTEPAKDVKTFTKNVAVVTVGTITSSKRAGKTEPKASLKAIKHYPSPLSSSEDDTIHNCYIIYPSIVS